MAPDALGIIKVAISAIASLKHIRPREESHDVRVQNAVSLILREIYFTPNGILSLLSEIADGDYPTEARLRRALVDFNDREWKIEEALKGLDFDALKKELGLSLNALSALILMRESKSQLRWTVQQEVNFYGQDGVWPEKTRVRKLIRAIENLNAEIGQIEAIINRRSSASPHPQRPPKKIVVRRNAPSRKPTRSRHKALKKVRVRKKRSPKGPS